MPEVQIELASAGAWRRVARTFRIAVFVVLGVEIATVMLIAYYGGPQHSLLYYLSVAAIGVASFCAIPFAIWTVVRVMELIDAETERQKTTYAISLGVVDPPARLRAWLARAPSLLGAMVRGLAGMATTYLGAHAMFIGLRDAWHNFFSFALLFGTACAGLLLLTLSEPEIGARATAVARHRRGDTLSPAPRYPADDKVRWGGFLVYAAVCVVAAAAVTQTQQRAWLFVSAGLAALLGLGALSFWGHLRRVREARRRNVARASSTPS